MPRRSGNDRQPQRARDDSLRFLFRARHRDRLHGLAWDIPLIGKFDLGLGFAAYNGLTAVAANFLVATILSAVWKSKAADQTLAADYEDEAAVANA